MLADPLSSYTVWDNDHAVTGGKPFILIASLKSVQTFDMAIQSFGAYGYGGRI